MNRIRIYSIILLLALVISPAAATVGQSSVSFDPNPPLELGSRQHVVAVYALIPSGATTFAKGHELQMQTGLTGAQWSIQVTLDGRNAALQTANGNAAFVNGELLSYSTNHDVGMVVTIDGTVPQNAADPFMVLEVEEIDNSGGVVPGSVLTITQPVSGQTPAGSPTAVPTLTPPVATATTPMKAAGFSCIPCTVATLIACVIWMRTPL